LAYGQINNLFMKTSISIKVLYWFTNIFYWVLIGALVLFISSRVLHVWDMDFDFSSTMGVRLDKELLNISSIQINEIETPIKVSKILGKVAIKDLPGGFSWVLDALAVVTITLFLYILNRVRAFFSRVKNDSIFTYENVILLTHASYGLFTYGLLDILTNLYMKWSYSIGSKTQINIDMPSIFFNNGFVFGLLLLVLAQIFKRGVELQNEVELTV
jgi:hypothetical protein